MVYHPTILQLVLAVPSPFVVAKHHATHVSSHWLYSGTGDHLRFKGQLLASFSASISNLMYVWSASLGISSLKNNWDVYRQSCKDKVTSEHGAPSTREDLPAFLEMLVTDFPRSTEDSWHCCPLKCYLRGKLKEHKRLWTDLSGCQNESSTQFTVIYPPAFIQIPTLWTLHLC